MGSINEEVKVEGVEKKKKSIQMVTNLDPMEEKQTLFKRYRERNRNFLKQIRRRKLQKLRKRKLQGSSSFELPQQNLEIPDCSFLAPGDDRDPVDEAKYRQQVEELSVKVGGATAIRCDYSEIVRGKVGLHCYNSHKGTNLVFNSVTKVYFHFGSYFNYHITLEAMDPTNNNALVTIQTCVSEAPEENDENLRLITCSCSIEGSGEHEYESEWNQNAVGEFYTGLMPKWLEDDALIGNQYYEVKESDLEENEWLYLYMEVAALAKWYSTTVDHLSLELKKVVVQTEEEDNESSMKLKSSNAIFFITFKVGGGEEYKGIIRQTRDGRPKHLCLEVVCEVAK